MIEVVIIYVIAVCIMLSMMYSVTDKILWYFQVCIIKEEWIGGQVKETVMTSCNIDDITTVEVDPVLPLYCIIVSVQYY